MRSILALVEYESSRTNIIYRGTAMGITFNIDYQLSFVVKGIT